VGRAAHRVQHMPLERVCGASAAAATAAGPAKQCSPTCMHQAGGADAPVGRQRWQHMPPAVLH
jgi:hypothetical protein